MPIQILPTIDVGGRIGQSFGKGLGSALEREATRGRLSKALQGSKENLMDPKTGQLKEGLSGLDVFTELTTALAGLTGGPEYLQTGLPLIMQQIQRKNPFKEEGDTTEPGGEGGVTPGPAAEKMLPPKVENYFNARKTQAIGTAGEGLQSPEQINGEYLRMLTGTNPTSLQSQEAIKAERAVPYTQTAQERANEISRIANDLQITPDQAANYNDRYVNQVNALQRSLLDKQSRDLAVEERGRSDLTQIVDKRLTSTEKDDISSLWPRMEDMVTSLVKGGESTRDAAKIVGERAKNFSSAKRALTAMAAVPSIAEPPKDWLNSIENIRKAYDEFGASQDLTAELQATLNSGPYAASAMAIPLNETIEKQITRLPDIHPNYFGKGFEHSTRRGKEMMRLETSMDRLKNTVIDKWGPKQSLKSLKFSLFSKIPNDEYVNTFINDLISDESITLTDLQKRELEELRDPMGAPDIGDFAAYFLGQSTQKQGPFARLFKRTVGSKYRL